MKPQQASRMFRWLRWRIFRNSLGVLMQHGQVRVFSILLCSIIVWAFIFTIFLYAFHAVQDHNDFPLHGEIMGFLFDLGYAALTLFLIFSTSIILSSSLFSSPESAFLLSSPVPDDHVFAYKFQGAVAFSSWAFVLLGSPVMIAYGIVIGSPWFYYLLMPLYFLGFVLLPGSIGALFCLVIVNFVPRRRRQLVWGLAGLIVVGVSAWLYMQFRDARHQFGTRAWVNQIFDAISVLRSRAMPSHWLAQGLQSAALGELENLFYYLALVWGNGLFFLLMTTWIAKRLYRRGFNRVSTGGSLRRRYGGIWMDRLVERLLFFVDRETRLLFVKDFRTFRRDPAQWAQIVIFLGLGLLYFSYVSRFYRQHIGVAFQNWISLLTLVATSFMMCAYTGRFIFPMLSLEGRKFWILGLLPMEREKLMWGKFAFSATGCFFLAELLILFSNVMLEMPWQIVAVHALTVAILALGFSGLSVGLGTCMPNFRERDPSKIAVGFGGTLNLVAGLSLLVVIVSLMAAPWHFVMQANKGYLVLGLRHLWMGLGLGIGIALGWAAVYFPLRMGARALRRMEF